MGGTINVSNAAELDAALHAAGGGETIVLAGGDYGTLSMGGRDLPGRYEAEVTLVSADAGDPARFEGMHLRGVSNLTLDALLFDYEHAPGHETYHRPFRMGGENLTVRNSTFDGDVARGTGDAGEGYPTGFALDVSGRGIVLENNAFGNFWKGAAASGQDIVVRGNEFHTMRSDGLNVSNADGVLIEGNHFHDFRKAEGSGDHADMLQFWIARPGEITQDVVIRGNLFDVGEGDATQTIFMGNNVHETGRGGAESFYRDIVIEENVILNGHHHGISLGATDGLTIANNTLLQKQGADAGDPMKPVTIPKININAEATNVTITGNVAPQIEAAQPGWTVDGNVLVQAHDPAAPGYAPAEFITSTLLEGVPVARPGGLVDAAGAGAPSDPGRAMFVAHDSPDGPGVRVLDAAAAMRAAGLEAEIADTRFAWRFEDGTVAEGPVVSRDFGAGTHEVALTVTRPDGAISSIEVPLTVASPVLLSFGSKGAAGALAGATADLAGGIDLDTDGGAALSLPDRDAGALYDAETLRIDMTLSADAAGAHGEVMHLLHAIRLSVTETGGLQMQVKGTEGNTGAKAEGLRLNDGAAHELSVVYDRAAQEVSVSVDGREALRTGVEGEFDGSRKGLDFGHAWGGRTFDATITDLRIEAGTGALDPYEGDPALIQEARLPDAEFGPVLALEPEVPVRPAPIFDLLEAGADEMNLSGGVTRTEGGGLAFDGTGGSADVTALRGMYDDGDLTLDMTFELSADTDDTARLFWSQGVLGLEVEGGVLRARVRTEEGFTCLKAEAPALEGDGPHKLTVAIDSALDRIQILVDDEVVMDEAEHDLDLTTGQAWQHRLGTPWSRHLDGEISAFEVRDEALFEELDEIEAGDAALLG